MKIKICQQNASAIMQALAAVNGKAASFTIAGYTTVADFAEKIEARLSLSGLPKGERAGVKATFKPAGPSANAYKYAAKSTAVTIERGAKDWYLTGVVETVVYPRQKETVLIKISAAQRDTIARQAIEPYIVTAPAALPVAAE